MKNIRQQHLEQLASQESNRKRGIFYGQRTAILSLGALLVLAVGFLIVVQLISPKLTIERDKYQVVYMTNGQAYFGKLKNTTGDYLIMEQPYTEQNVSSSESKNGDKVTQDQATLLKVSDQVYGPENSIAIKSSQVAFWQNLREDSKVAQAISSKQ